VVQLVENIYENTPDLNTQLKDDQNLIASGGRFSIGEGPPREVPASTEPAETVDETQVGDTEFSEPVQQDKMRSLFARYAASVLECMKGNANFMELVRIQGEFAQDLVKAAKNGNPIGSDELWKL